MRIHSLTDSQLSQVFKLIDEGHKCLARAQEILQNSAITAIPDEETSINRLASAASKDRPMMDQGVRARDY